MGTATRIFKKVSGQGTFRKWLFWKKGDYVIGKVLSRIGEMYKGKTRYKYELEVEETNFNSNGFVDPKGKAKDCGNLKAGTLAVVNGCAILDNIFDKGSFGIGDTIKVEFDRKDLVKSGEFAGQDMNIITVEVAEVSCADGTKAIPAEKLQGKTTDVKDEDEEWLN